ncbi:MAG TPA: ABC transporter permease [Cytophagaceae bacterium]|jgi:ABC-2 type transport system permease protein|nr:ABC transporter permease [Cytophagaceae bacterium]
MKKLWLIIKREYLSRILKKSFLLMTLLGPILFMAMTVVPVWMSTNSEKEQVIEVLDQSNLFEQRFTDLPGLRFAYFHENLELTKINFMSHEHEALLYIPDSDLKGLQQIQLFSKNSLSPALRNYIKDAVNKEIYNIRLEESYDPDSLIFMRSKITVTEIPVSDSMENTNMKAAIAASMFFSLLTFFFIFIYSGRVMRAVIEEKSNRIIEVIISSVKPFQLMMGKILGIALVSLTQFLLWLLLSFSLVFMFQHKYQKNLVLFNNENIGKTLEQTTNIKQALEMNEILNAFNSIDFSLLIFCFIIYFLGGYLLYSSLFAAIGSTTDNETDTQQFVLPVVIPLLSSFMMLTHILQEPFGSLAFWMSMIPFTSPVVMMIRIPFGVPLHEILASLTILIITFLLCTWLAAKIYRVGILMYGKKITYAELGKWLRYKN